MEILLHTLSHQDLLVELTVTTVTSTGTSSNDETKVCTTFLARPLSHAFHAISEAIHAASTAATAAFKDLDIVHYPYHDPFSQTSGVMHYPIGFSLTSCPILYSRKQVVSSFRVKTLLPPVSSSPSTVMTIGMTKVMFPLLAMLLPKWLKTLNVFQSTESHKAVCLISGSGASGLSSPSSPTQNHPRPQSDGQRIVDHPSMRNSTALCAVLMKQLLQRSYLMEHMVVDCVDSGPSSDLFRYDDNVTFVTTVLHPLLEAKRQVIVDLVGDQWKYHFHLTIAYGGGTPARLSAVKASLRLYRPSFFHIWQLKRYWHEETLRLEDLEFHSFETIQASPSLTLAQLSASPAHSHVVTVVTEMKAFRDAFLESFRLKDTELESFWLRKTKKPVLAVLLVSKTHESAPRMYRGMNCEVSMPTGSLCAERNVIGSALAHDPTLHRRDLKMIAVLSVRSLEKPFMTHPVTSASSGRSSSTSRSPTRLKRLRTYSCDDHTSRHLGAAEEDADLNPLDPCGACQEWLLKIAAANPALRVIRFSNLACEEVFINQLM